MIVNASSQMLSLNPPKSTAYRPKASEQSCGLSRSCHRSDTVSISETGKSLLEGKIKNTGRAGESLELFDLRGDEGKIWLGSIVLGMDTVSDWSAKGLEISEASLIEAAETFQEGLRENMERYGSKTAGSGIAINRYQVVINAQEVPDWFVKEYESFLSSIDDPTLRSSFEKGETYF